MGTISSNKKRRPWLSSTQLKYALTYIFITLAVLLFLNFYAVRSTQRLIFQNKSSMLEDKLQMAVTGFAHTDEVDADSAARVLGQLGDLNMTRVLVVNRTGTVVYDSAVGESALGQLSLLPELVSAMEGNDVIYGVYRSSGMEMRGAMPILYRGSLTGAVYMMEYDAEQARLIGSLQDNILRISLVLAGAVILFSLIFTATFSRRMRHILESVRIIRQGDYSHKVRLKGRDELALLGEEFNSLTDRLQDSERRRRQFVSDASHELKTPLASIKLLSDSILQNDMDQETLREFVGDIGSEADRLTRMSQKLLSLTKADAECESGAGQREIADLALTAKRVLRMLAPVAQLQTISLIDRTEPGCTILILEDDLYQIIFNLVENGIKYNVIGGSLTVTTQHDGEDVRLLVEDTGVGIPAEALPYIFDRFYRVDKARSRKAGGSGLGLSIVHDMVLRNDGQIAVTPREGGGTCFAVTFPAFDME